MFAELSKSYDILINEHVNQNNFVKALQQMHKLEDNNKRNEMMYKFASIFFYECAKETKDHIETYNDLYSGLELHKIMPALMTIQPGENQQNYEVALQFINEYCIIKR